MKITIFTITDCTFSQAEKEYLKSKNIQFEEKNLETNKDFLQQMLAASNNFAGTPVTKIEKDDGQIVVIKGFTQEEFDKALNMAPTTNQSTPAPVQQDATAAAAPVMPAPLNQDPNIPSIQPPQMPQDMNPQVLQPPQDMQAPVQAQTMPPMGMMSVPVTTDDNQQAISAALNTIQNEPSVSAQPVVPQSTAPPAI